MSSGEAGVEWAVGGGGGVGVEDGLKLANHVKLQPVEDRTRVWAAAYSLNT